MRHLVLLCLTLLLAPLAAADLAYARVVITDTESLEGWWDNDTKVLYLADGTHRWIRAPKSAAPQAAPAGSVKPAKRSFRRVPDLPYGLVAGPNGQQFTGWYHAETGKVYDHHDPFPRGFSPDTARWVQAVQPPGPMPGFVRESLDLWAIANAHRLDPVPKR